MRINSLDIEYFRCFEKYHIDFASHVTVLIGKNGSGKTTLLTALHKALSFIFYKDSNDERTLTSGMPSLSVESYKKCDSLIDRRSRTMYPYISIKSTADFKGVELEWEMRANTSTYRMQPKWYKNTFFSFYDRYLEIGFLPLLATYSDGFPHVTANNIDVSREMELRNFGYYQWNEDSACISVWLERLKSIWLTLDRYGRGTPVASEEKIAVYREEFAFVKGKLIDFSRDADAEWQINEIVVDAMNRDELSMVMGDGSIKSFSMLPAGYKRLLYIVLDLGYRSYKLSGVQATSGVVIIDEIDLHLHPTLEQNVLNWLMRTFPEVQFVVSTHSAQVIANLNAQDQNKCKLYFMEHGQEAPRLLPNLYGINYNAAIRDYMGTGTNEQVKELMDRYRIYEELEMAVEMADVRNKILALVGEEGLKLIMDDPYYR